MNPNHLNVRLQSPLRLQKIFSRMALTAMAIVFALPVAANECIVQQNSVSGGKTELQVVKVVRGNPDSSDSGRIYYETRFIDGRKLASAAATDRPFQSMLTSEGSFLGSREEDFNESLNLCRTRVPFKDGTSLSEKERICRHALATGQTELGGVPLPHRRNFSNQPLGFSELQQANHWASLQRNNRESAQRFIASTGTIAIRVPVAQAAAKRNALQEAFNRKASVLGCSIVPVEQQKRIEQAYATQPQPDSACQPSKQ